jgi:hypothetical protein
MLYIDRRAVFSTISAQKNRRSGKAPPRPSSSLIMKTDRSIQKIEKDAPPCPPKPEKRRRSLPARLCLSTEGARGHVLTFNSSSALAREQENRNQPVPSMLNVNVASIFASS